jgi:hypothetical protein
VGVLLVQSPKRFTLSPFKKNRSYPSASR